MKVGMTWKVKKDKKGNYVGPDAMPAGLLRNVKARKEVTIETEVGRLEVKHSGTTGNTRCPDKQ